MINSICSSNENVYNCNHSNHLFAHPLCDEQSLLKRIANVAFHILTLGIPLAFYHVIKCCFSKRSSHEFTNIQGSGIASVSENNYIKPYSSLGRETLEFARQQLKNAKGLSEIKFTHPKAYQPINKNISLLASLASKLWDKFENALKRHKENSWSHPEVIQAADEYMKIEYAISSLTLDDLEPFTQKLASKGVSMNYVKALTSYDSYQLFTFFYCSRAYHMIRGAVTWGKTPWSKKEEVNYVKEIPTEHVKSFYELGTIQNKWNALYNEFCDRVKLYVDENELKKADSRHFNWIKKDTGDNKFYHTPDTLPAH